jgi:putative transposase
MGTRSRRRRTNSTALNWARAGPLPDAELRKRIYRVHDANWGLCVPRRVLLTVNRKGVPVARCTVERLMGELGLTGARWGKVKRTTIGAPHVDRAQTLVHREFHPVPPNMLWVGRWYMSRS